MTESAPLVGLIMGSLSDYPKLKNGLDLFEAWGTPYEVIVASAHRTPDRVEKWSREAEARGLEVIIAAAGGAAHLAGVVAANTLLPVIGLPIESGALHGVDSLYSIVQMPPGIPVATVGVNSGANAAVLALHILARIDDHWRAVLRDYRAGMGDKIDRQNEELRAERPGAVWADEPAPAPRKKKESDAPPSPRRVGRVRLDSDLMSPEIVESAVDCLLDGGIVAMPTDTVYGLAVDATNDAAVRRLFEVKRRDPQRSIAIFIESTRALTLLVKNLSADVRQLLEAFWPGPLTVVFERRNDDFSHVAQGSTLGVRIPDHSVPLTLMQELHRPIACTSANLSGQATPLTPDEIEAAFGKQIEMLLDAGPAEPRPASTVLDVSVAPFRMLRAGAIDADQIAAVVGDRLAAANGD